MINFIIYCLAQIQTNVISTIYMLRVNVNQYVDVDASPYFTIDQVLENEMAVNR